MDKELHIALIQTTLFWEDPQTNRKAFSHKLASVREGTDLIILPEMFTTGFTMTPENLDPEEGPRTLHWMKQEASKNRAAICGSTVYQENGLFYNRLFFVTPEGEFTAYDKRHTFTLSGEDKVYAAGRSREIINYRGFRIFPLICYDLRFPVWSRNMSDYDILVYVANWPAVRVDAWDALLKARAIENMALCVGVNRIGADSNGHSYTGHSAAYDCLGHQLVYSEDDTTLYATIGKAHLEQTRGSLKFLNDRDSFTLEY